MAGKKVEGAKDSDFALFALLGVGAFAAAFFVFGYLNSHSPKELGGVAFQTEGAEPGEALKSFFAGKGNVSLSVELAGVENVTCVSAMLTQVALAFGASNKNVIVQGETSRGVCVDSNNSQFQCKAADAVVARGACNCVKIGSNGVRVEGSDEFLCSKAGAVGSVFVSALGGKFVSREDAQRILSGYGAGADSS